VHRLKIPFKIQYFYCIHQSFMYIINIEKVTLTLHMGQLKDPWLNYGDYIKIDNLAARAGSNEFVVLHPVSG